MASVAQVHAAAMNLATTLVNGELAKSRPATLHQVRQRNKPSPLTHLKALVALQAAMKPQATANNPAAVPQVNPFTAAPTQTPQQGLLALLSQKGAPPSPNGMV